MMGLGSRGTAALRVDGPSLDFRACSRWGAARSVRARRWSGALGPPSPVNGGGVGGGGRCTSTAPRSPPPLGGGRRGKPEGRSSWDAIFCTPTRDAGDRGAHEPAPGFLVSLGRRGVGERRGRELVGVGVVERA